MAKINLCDQNRITNRNRVRNHRFKQHLKKVHNVRINERVKHLNSVFENVECDVTNEKPTDEEIPTKLKDDLRIWVINHRITRSALSDLLVILISAGFCFLPKDARTLMATPVKVPIDILSNGKLWYFGIQQCIKNVFAEIRNNIEITLDFHFDGLPISKSSSKQFWPILSSIRG